MYVFGKSYRAINDVQAQELSPKLKLHFDLNWNLGTVVLELCL